jgi:hypothetical protein
MNFDFARPNRTNRPIQVTELFQNEEAVSNGSFPESSFLTSSRCGPFEENLERIRDTFVFLASGILTYWIQSLYRLSQRLEGLQRRIEKSWGIRNSYAWIQDGPGGLPRKVKTIEPRRSWIKRLKNLPVEHL